MLDELLNFILAPTNAAVLAGVVVLLWLAAKVRRAIRMRRPARVNAKLAQYGSDDTEAVNRRLQLAAKIVATSSSRRIVGYRIVRQIDAVFEDGHRSPASAVDALKAAAAMRGANAVINLTQQRTAAGRCSAQGDAVVVEPDAVIAEETTDD